MIFQNLLPFFSLVKKKQQGNYHKPVNIPRYLPKESFFTCVFPKDQFKIEGDRIRLSLGLWFQSNMNRNYLHFRIPPNVIGHAIKQLLILPMYNGRYFEMEIVYMKDPIPTDLHNNRYLGIDLGIGNFASCYSSIGASFILEGQGLKSYNRWWNKLE